MLHPRLEAVFRDFDHAGIRWCALRLPSDSDISAGDIDLLIDRADVPLACQVLMRLEFAQLPGWRPGLHLVSYHLHTDRWLWFHIVTELSFGGDSTLHTGAEAGCLNRRQRGGVISTLGPDDGFWVLLLHCLLDKSHIAPRHKTHLQELAEAALSDGTLAQVVAAVCPSGWNTARIVEYVRQGNWIQLEQFAPSLAAAWRQRYPIGTWQMLFQRTRRLIDKLLNFPRSRGLSVALLGPDGAGKSTLINGIKESFLLPVRSVYMGLTGGLLPYVDRLRLPVFVVPGHLVIFWCRYLRAQYHQWRGRLVIFDRYVYDWVAPTPHPLTCWGRINRWIDGHSVPAPDLVLILDAPGKVMYQRKGEYDVEQLENWRQHFLTLQNRITKLEIVDTTRPQKTVRDDVMDRIWRRYVARWQNPKLI